MKRFQKQLTIIFCCFFTLCNAQHNNNSDRNIVIGIVDSLYSEGLNEQRDIWIHVPKSYDDTKKYPVIYVLDATKNFYLTVGLLKQLTPWQIPESIIVGIKNTDRTRDFTPTNVPFQRGRQSKTSGGASKFVKFITEEIKPYITSSYATENNSTIIGHSTGGLFVLYAYLNHETVFDNYIAIDPSLWWDNEQLVKSAQAQINKNNYKEKSLYVAVANSLGKALDTVKVRHDKSEPTEQIRANLKFHDILVKNKSKLNFNWEYFKDEDHGSVVVSAQYNGLQSVFSWFVFPELWQFNTPKRFSVQELIQPYYAHYKKLSKYMKREVKPDWQLINDIGQFMIEGHQLPDKARAFFEMNLDFYPDNSKSYEALGDFHLSQKENLVAKAYYKKAVEIGGRETARKKLDKL